MQGDTRADLRTWLSERGLDAYFVLLARHEIDLEALFQLEYAHLQEMGFTLGARLKLLKAISAHAGPAGPGGGDAAKIPRTGALAAERRQITAMFCDIVGYTHLASRIDPEETRRLLHGYWQRIEETTAAYQGHIAQYLGDGALIYFGYPAAREDDAERAVAASLALLSLLTDAGKTDSARLHIRMGIATGLVVVGDDLGRGDAARGALAVGQTVNLAARLQALARPGCVVVDESTRRIVGDLFAFEPLGPMAIAGLDTDLPVFKVIGTRKARTRFEARRATAQGEMVGRASEIAVGLDLWRRIVQGQGQMLLVDGEPGIGKSHFAFELARIIAEGGAEVLPMQCSPNHIDTPFYPLIEGLSWLAGITQADAAAEKAAKFKGLFARRQPVMDDDRALLAGLVGAAIPQPEPAGPDTPTLRRQRTFAALAEFFAERARTRPLLIVIEDVHWCDPTTLDVLGILRKEIHRLPIMLVATTRHRDRAFCDTPPPVRMSLPRLGAADTGALVQKLFAGKAVSEQTLAFISARTDGVPLFIEELAKTVRDTSASDANGAVLDDARDLESIPNSLQGILMERLDTLQSAKRVAQVAACMGRDFDGALLASIVDMPAAELAEALDRLLAGEMVVATAGAAQGSFRFKHALVCDAAYSSLLFSERRTIHGVIAKALGSLPTRPEILAHHLTQAQDVVPAIEKWQEAAIAAKLRSANVEAIAHIGKALRLLDQLKSAEARKAREFSLLIELIAPYRATKGFAAREVADVTERAILLADEARDVRGVLPLLYNQWVYRFVTAHRDVCQKFAEEIMARCDYDDNDLLRMTGLRALAVTDFTRGRFAEAVEGFQASAALYAPERQADATQLVGLDALVVASGYNSLACWCLGRTGDALASIERALSHAHRIAHASTTIFAIYHETLLKGVLERDAAVLRTNGATLERLGLQHHFDMWAVCGRLLGSMGACLAETTHQNVQRVIGHLSDYQDMGVVYRPTYETFIAEAWLKLKDRQRGFEHIGRARAVVEESGELWSESEIFRVEGELCLLDDADRDRAARLIEKAADIASAQGAQSFHAKALASLAGLESRPARPPKATAKPRLP